MQEGKARGGRQVGGRVGAACRAHAALLLGLVRGPEDCAHSSRRALLHTHEPAVYDYLGPTWLRENYACKTDSGVRWALRPHTLVA